ncbi:unnamed protein product [Malus baccata var. baccata]
MRAYDHCHYEVWFHDHDLERSQEEPFGGAQLKLLKNAQEKISKGEATDKDWMELTDKVLKLANLEVVAVTKKNVVTTPPKLKEEIVKANAGIYEEIERVVNEARIRGRIEELKADIGKGLSGSERKREGRSKEKGGDSCCFGCRSTKSKG